MNTLVLDCSAGMSVYVLKGDEIFSSVEQDQKKHTDNLLLVVDDLLKKAELKIGDVQNFCVCVGPGSFTGIRVAISVCKGICTATKAKIFTCSNFDSFSYGESDPAIFVLEAFSNYVYVRRFDGKSSIDSCETLDEFKHTLSGKENIYADNEKTQNLLKNYEIQANIAQNHVINVFKDKIKNNEFIEMNEIVPIYLRASQAEIEREKKLKESQNG